jgi:hypothetical protein
MVKESKGIWVDRVKGGRLRVSLKDLRIWIS